MQLKICHRTYTVRPLSPKEQHEDRLHGISDTARRDIGVDPDLDPEDQARVLLHEIMHVLYFETGLYEVEKQTEETVVSHLDRGLAGVLQSNPYLFEVLHQGLSGRRGVFSPTTKKA